MTEGLEAAAEALEERTVKDVPTEFIMKLLEIILRFNIFEFNSEYFIQLIGTAMGAVPAVSYANVFMAKKIDPKILETAEKIKNSNQNQNPIIFMKRFLDDIFLVWRDSIENLHKFVKMLNSIHPSIKFTMQHCSIKDQPQTCDCTPSNSIPFLDTSCYISDNKIITDLFKKETDRNQYLLTSSCHPVHICDNIPYSLALRIVRICVLPTDREKRFAELKQMLLDRDYKSKSIDAAIEKARSVNREDALKKVVTTKSDDRVVFVTHFDPRLPSITNIVRKHYRSMVSQNMYLSQVFPSAPLIAFKRPKNLRETLIKARVPPTNTRPRRVQNGYKKCIRPSCLTCPYSITGKIIKATATDFKTEVNAPVNCYSKNVIYLITCKHCNEQYVGETFRTANDRFLNHRGYVNNNKDKKATGHHFNLPGHSISDMKFQIIEKVHNKDPFFRKEREKMYINKLNTKLKGINRIS